MCLAGAQQSIIDYEYISSAKGYRDIRMFTNEFFVAVLVVLGGCLLEGLGEVEDLLTKRVEEQDYRSTN